MPELVPELSCGSSEGSEQGGPDPEGRRLWMTETAVSCVTLKKGERVQGFWAK